LFLLYIYNLLKEFGEDLKEAKLPQWVISDRLLRCKSIA